jgi:putative ABC transport system substrate-binding protein
VIDPRDAGELKRVLDTYFLLSGGIASYGPNTIDIYRRAATYVDRILKGAKPGELPGQAPIRYERVIDL